MRIKNITGPRIRQARRKKGVTQLALAARLQLLGVMIDRSGIAKLETDRRPVSDIEIAAIAKVLEVDILSLFEERNSLLEQLNRGNELEHGTANRSAEKPNKSRDSSDR